jgi:hypothetical protein
MMMMMRRRERERKRRRCLLVFAQEPIKKISQERKISERGELAPA